MEFWGVEVKAGQTLKIHPEEGKLIHISQAALGEVKDVKGARNVPLRLRIDFKNFIIGSLAAEDRTQLMFDLVFEKDFELSHDWKNGSVFFIGYIADDPTDGEEFSDEDDEEEEHEHVHTGKCDHKPAEVKAKKETPVKPVPTKLESDSDDDEIDSDDSDEEMAVLGEDDVSDLSGDDSEDGGSSEEEELPKQAKKRPAEPAQQIPVPAKKAKAATPDNKQGNKKGQNATPLPSKAAAGKMTAGNKSNDKSPKSAGQSSNKSRKNFPSGKAQVSHSKGKHGGK